MRIRTIAVSLLIFLSVYSAGFSFHFADVVFPFKGFAYHGAGIPLADVQNVIVTKETPYVLEFTYQGGNYKATLFTFGAVYLERPNKQNPILITFDMADYKLDAKFLSLHDYD